VSDIIVAPGVTLTTRFRLLGNGTASSTITVWMPDPGHPEDFVKFREVKLPDDPEGQFYNVGTADELDGKVIEWLFTAEPFPGNISQPRAEFEIRCDGVSADGFPLVKAFSYTNPPVTKTISRRFEVKS
jgi:hypothetical protein